MAHPHEEHRAYKVERQRVGRITSAYEQPEHGDAEADSALISRMVKPTALKRARGGAVEAPGELKKIYPKRDSLAVEGSNAKERLDRPGRALRAKGGRTKHKGVNVNVIVAPQGGDKGPLPMPPPTPAAAAPPPSMPPVAARPPMPPPGPPGAAGPIRAHGGRTYARGGRVSDGPAWKEGVNAGTPVQNNPSGKNDQRDVNRGKPFTYATGGRIYSAAKGQMAPRLPGGSGGGLARIAKMKRAKTGYAKARARGG